MTRYDVVTLGELLIDFTDSGDNGNGLTTFTRNPGGAVTNLIAAVAKCGGRTGFIGKVGNDLHGRYLRDYMEGLGVDCRGLVFDDDYRTTLAFVKVEKNGDRDFVFYRKHEADIRIRPDEVPEDMPADTKIFHFGSLSLIDEPARSATAKAVGAAGAAGAVISYDPNYRAGLWDAETAVPVMAAALSDADYVKLSEDEAELITGGRGAEDCIARLPANVRFAAVTRGENGVVYASRPGGWIASMPAYRPQTTDALDTTGAGDIFYGTLLYGLLRSGADIADRAAVAEAVRTAVVAAGISTTRPGGMPSIPSPDEVAAAAAVWRP